VFVVFTVFAVFAAVDAQVSPFGEAFGSVFVSHSPITVPSGLSVVLTVSWKVLTYQSYWRHP
jgi:hypothetical protein